MELELNETWLNGKWDKKPDGDYMYEINTSMSYISIGEYFVQGEQADSTIKEIHEIWTREDITVLDAIKKWESMYL